MSYTDVVRYLELYFMYCIYMRLKSMLHAPLCIRIPNLLLLDPEHNTARISTTSSRPLLFFFFFLLVTAYIAISNCLTTHIENVELPLPDVVHFLYTGRGVLNRKRVYKKQEGVCANVRVRHLHEQNATHPCGKCPI